MMRYDQSLRHEAKVGASKAQGDTMLALLCCTLAAVHAINPRLVYEGAKKKGSVLLFLLSSPLTKLQAHQIASMSSSSAARAAACAAPTASFINWLGTIYTKTQG